MPWCSGWFTKHTKKTNLKLGYVAFSRQVEEDTRHIQSWQFLSLKRLKLTTHSVTVWGGKMMKLGRYIHPPTEIFSLQQAATVTGSCGWQAASTITRQQFEWRGLWPMRTPRALVYSNAPFAWTNQGAERQKGGGEKLCCGLRGCFVWGGILLF